MTADWESHAANPSSLLLTSSCLHTLTTAVRRITYKNGNIPTGQQHVIHMKYYDIFSMMHNDMNQKRSIVNRS